MALVRALALLVLAGCSSSDPEPLAPPPPSPSPPTSSVLEVTSQPPGASIAIDHVDIGETTPAFVVVPPGRHHVALGLPDHVSIEMMVLAEDERVVLPEMMLTEVVKPDPVEVEVAPEPPRPTPAPTPAQQWVHGQLMINSVPWSQVTVDGRPIGNTPIRGLRVVAGVHTIELVNGLRPAQRTTRHVTVDADQTTPVVVRFGDFVGMLPR